MANEGYAAVTSRRVAEQAGLNRALVHYYFHTMDDLFLALFRRRAQQGLTTQAKALQSDQPLWALWDLYRDTQGTVLTMEFVALANHRKAIRAEIARYAERYRAAQIEAVRTALAHHDIADDRLPAIVALLAMTGLSQVLALEDALGVTTGHDTTRAFVDRLLEQLERNG